ncbi:hypothetical protein HAX54_009320, partial [Datura stramonium]|nr:hypothetical protein [Datura stramonium]
TVDRRSVVEGGSESWLIIGSYWFHKTTVVVEFPLQRDHGDGRSFVVMDWGSNRRVRCSGFLTAIADLLQRKGSHCSGQRESESEFK